MWKSQAGIAPNNSKASATDDGDDWETDANHENTLDERAKRLGGTQHQCVDMQSLRQQVQAGDQDRIAKAEKSYKHGFGGAFGVQKDRQDKSAANWEYKAEVVQHSSQRTDKPQLKAKSESVVTAMELINERVKQKDEPKPVGSAEKSAAVTAKIAEAKQRFFATNMPAKNNNTFIRPGVSSNFQAYTTAKEFPNRDPNSAVEPAFNAAGNIASDASIGQPAEQSLISASVLFDYQKAADDEIDLEPGDIILNIRKLDEGWWYGENAKTGQSGLFPANYVQEQ